MSRADCMCVCGHVWNEHGRDPVFPDATACNAEDEDGEVCGCGAFDRDEQPVNRDDVQRPVPVNPHEIVGQPPFDAVGCPRCGQVLSNADHLVPDEAWTEMIGDFSSEECPVTPEQAAQRESTGARRSGGLA